ncbi:hypothetical protein [Denitrificimonas caeni]
MVLLVLGVVLVLWGESIMESFSSG